MCVCVCGRLFCAGALFLCAAPLPSASPGLLASLRLPWHLPWPALMAPPPPSPRCNRPPPATPLHLTPTPPPLPPLAGRRPQLPAGPRRHQPAQRRLQEGGAPEDVFRAAAPVPGARGGLGWGGLPACPDAYAAPRCAAPRCAVPRCAAPRCFQARDMRERVRACHDTARRLRPCPPPHPTHTHTHTVDVDHNGDLLLLRYLLTLMHQDLHARLAVRGGGGGGAHRGTQGRSTRRRRRGWCARLGPGSGCWLPFG